jgi:hypothetical protein
MVIGGGLMVAAGPLLLAIALLTKNGDCSEVAGTITAEEHDRCSNDVRTYSLTIGGVLLLGGGIPLIVIGSEKVPVAPVAQASISPWLGPEVAGLNLRLDL